MGDTVRIYSWIGFSLGKLSDVKFERRKFTLISHLNPPYCVAQRSLMWSWDASSAPRSCSCIADRQTVFSFPYNMFVLQRLDFEGCIFNGNQNSHSDSVILDNKMKDCRLQPLAEVRRFIMLWEMLVIVALRTSPADTLLAFGFYGFLVKLPSSP